MALIRALAGVLVCSGHIFAGTLARGVGVSKDRNALALEILDQPAAIGELLVQIGDLNYSLDGLGLSVGAPSRDSKASGAGFASLP